MLEECEDHEICNCECYATDPNLRHSVAYSEICSTCGAKVKVNYDRYDDCIWHSKDDGVLKDISWI